jgi:diguanylate cyclase (GGDEF)-like protein
MERKENLINLYLLMLLPGGLAAVIWAISGFPFLKVDLGLIALSIATVFLSSFLRIELPRNNIHLTISDALIILSMLIYGGEVAVLLAVFETAFTSFNVRRKGVPIKTRTIFINTLIAAIVVWVAALYVRSMIGTDGLRGLELADFVGLLSSIALLMFFANTICVSPFLAIKSQKSLVQIWKDYCLDALVMYLIGALVAGLMVRALDQTNVYLFAGLIAFFGLIYWTYRRIVHDVKKTSAEAQYAEQQRAEQAEYHVTELEHYVAELERSGIALRESREKFRHAAYHDELTGLPNRTQFLEVLNSMIEQARQRPDIKFAVFFLDLNRFKTLNESLGHSVGDQLIVDVGKRLSEMKREGDLVGRFSGDEFAILLTGIRWPAEATNFAEDVAAKLAEPFTLEGRQVFTSASIGIAFWHPKYEMADELTRDSDIAMYYAKEKQKSFVVFDHEMHDRAVSLLELETDLRFAVERNEFELYYQPIVNLDDARLEGFEALVRWNHPRRGLVAPSEFIELAESTGLIIPMTVQILRSACRQLAEWQRSSPVNRSLMMSVNISVKHFTDPGLVQQILAILNETGVDPAQLKLEITEGAVMENAENAISMLNSIKATGVKLSIDDFGTGYSSLSYLHRFPIDTLKIDRSFVSSMEEGTENGEIVRTIIALAKALKLNVVAEGIESVHQFRRLRILGCQFGQGYLFSRPLTVSDVETLLIDRFRWRNILHSEDFGVIAERGDYEPLFTTQ